MQGPILGIALFIAALCFILYKLGGPPEGGPHD
jgi:hypothetical protein